MDKKARAAAMSELKAGIQGLRDQLGMDKKPKPKEESKPTYMDKKARAAAMSELKAGIQGLRDQLGMDKQYKPKPKDEPKPKPKPKISLSSGSVPPEMKAATLAALRRLQKEKEGGSKLKLATGPITPERQAAVIAAVQKISQSKSEGEGEGELNEETPGRCPAIIQSGKRSGKSCDYATKGGAMFCGVHRGLASEVQ